MNEGFQITYTGEEVQELLDKAGTAVQTETDPTVPSWAKAESKPSYAVGEISGAQEALVSGTNIKTINNTSVLGSGNISIQGGDTNIIESISFNGSSVPVDGNKNAAITYTAPVTSVNGNTGAVVISVPTKVSDLTNDAGYITSYTETDPVFSASAAHSITSADITAWNGKSDFSGSYNDLTDKPTIPIVPTTLSSFTDDLGSNPTHTHSQYLTQHQDISGKADKSEMSVSTSSDQTTITLKSGTSATVINQHQSLSGYVQTSNIAGLIKNDGTIDTTSYGTYSKPAGGIPASDIASGVIPVVPSNIVVGNSQSYTIAVVSSLPASPDADTIYLVTGS